MYTGYGYFEVDKADFDSYWSILHNNRELFAATNDLDYNDTEDGKIFLQTKDGKNFFNAYSQYNKFEIYFDKDIFNLLPNLNITDRQKIEEIYKKYNKELAVEELTLEDSEEFISMQSKLLKVAKEAKLNNNTNCVLQGQVSSSGGGEAIGSFGANPCIIIIGYSEKTKTAICAHIDLNSKIEDFFKKSFFQSEEKIKLYVASGFLSRDRKKHIYDNVKNNLKIEFQGFIDSSNLYLDTSTGNVFSSSAIPYVDEKELTAANFLTQINTHKLTEKTKKLTEVYQQTGQIIQSTLGPESNTKYTAPS